jgi:hypothetical protein
MNKGLNVQKSQSAVIAGEFVAEHNMVALSALNNTKAEDGRTRAIIISTLSVFKGDNHAAVLHSQHWFIGLPETFDIKIIGVPWSSIEVAVEALQTKDMKLLDYMEKRYGWHMATLLNDELYLDGRINKSPAALDQLTLFEFNRKTEQIPIGKVEVLHYQDGGDKPA